MPTRQTLLTQLNESVAQGIRWNLFAVVLQDKVVLPRLVGER